MKNMLGSEVSYFMGIVGLGVVGLGRMGRLYVDIIAKFIDNAKLIGVTSRTYSKAERIAKEYGVKAYRSYDEMLRDPQVNGVIIATPSYMHAEMIVRAAEEGKHVFSEKPIDVNIDKARGAVKAVERHGVKLLVGYMRRFDHAYRRAKELIDEDSIGKPILYIGISKDPEPPPEGWLRDPKLSGGLILDLMSHDFDLARWFLGSEVIEVYAKGDVYIYDYMKGLEDYDNVMATLKFSNGAIAFIYGSRRSSYGYDVRSEVHGTEGTIFIGSEYNNSLRLGRNGGIRFNGHLWFQKRFFEAYVEEVRHFVDLIRRDLKPLVSGEDALKALEIANAVRRSIKEGRPIRLS